MLKTRIIGLVLAITVVSTPWRPSRPPNLLLISLDTLRADHLGSYGYVRATSPFIDAVAWQGHRFSHAFVNALGTSPSHATMLSSLYQETHRVDYPAGAFNQVPDEVEMVQEILQEHGYYTLAVTDGGYMSRTHGFAQGFDEFYDDLTGVAAGAERLVERVRAITEAEASGRPIFAFFHTYEVHSPYFVPPEYATLFGTFESSFVPSSENLLAILDSAARDLTASDFEFLVARYDQGIRYTDDTLRQMFADLDALDFFDQYLLIVTSDHGEEFGEHGGVLHRGRLYEELLRIPLILAGTRVRRGVVDDHLASSIDIAPTLLRQAGLRPPLQMEGRDLLSRVEPTGREAGVVFSQYNNARYAMRTRDWKLIVSDMRQIPEDPLQDIEHRTIELYNVRGDPTEREDQARHETGRVTEMLAHLQKWKRRLPTSVGREAELAGPSEEQLERLKSLGYVAR